MEPDGAVVAVLRDTAVVQLNTATMQRDTAVQRETVVQRDTAVYAEIVKQRDAAVCTETADCVVASCHIHAAPLRPPPYSILRPPPAL